jgi:3-methyladenine DNA glycosylase AlkD
MPIDIINTFYSAYDADNAIKMSAYMKNNFPFLGLPKPKRAELSKDFLNSKKKDTAIDWVFGFLCYDKPEREFHYLAID